MLIHVNSKWEVFRPYLHYFMEKWTFLHSAQHITHIFELYFTFYCLSSCQCLMYMPSSTKWLNMLKMSGNAPLGPPQMRPWRIHNQLSRY